MDLRTLLRSWRGRQKPRFAATEQTGGAGAGNSNADELLRTGVSQRQSGRYQEALVSLRKLEEDYMAAANRLADAMSGNVRREMMELALHAQNVGVEASARVATMMGEFASGRGATPGLETMRDASVRMALLASGVLAGVADALRDQTEAKKDK